MRISIFSIHQPRLLFFDQKVERSKAYRSDAGLHDRAVRQVIVPIQSSFIKESASHILPTVESLRTPLSPCI
jgi:hypothetical protein